MLGTRRPRAGRATAPPSWARVRCSSAAGCKAPPVATPRAARAARRQRQRWTLWDRASSTTSIWRTLPPAAPGDGAAEGAASQEAAALLLGIVDRRCFGSVCFPGSTRCRQYQHQQHLRRALAIVGVDRASCQARWRSCASLLQPSHQCHLRPTATSWPGRGAACRARRLEGRRARHHAWPRRPRPKRRRESKRSWRIRCGAPFTRLSGFLGRSIGQ